MLAKATAGEIDATFFRISPADVLSKWVGEAEQNLKKLFDAAATEPRAIIFIDEIESLVPARRDEGAHLLAHELDLLPRVLGDERSRRSEAGAHLFGVRLRVRHRSPFCVHAGDRSRSRRPARS